MAVCNAPRSGSPVDDGDDVIKFTDSDCETILEELDTPRKKKQTKFTKNPSNSVVSGISLSKRKKEVISKSKHTEELSTTILLNDNCDTNRPRSAFSKVKHSKKKNHTSLENSAIVQSYRKDNLHKHSNPVPKGNESGCVSKPSSNQEDDGTRHHGNSELEDLRNVVGDVLRYNEIQENETADEIPKVTLNISNLESPEGGENPGSKPRRSSTSSSNSSVRDQGSQTSIEAAGDVLQYPVSPRVSPATVARYSPRRITSAELHRTPEQMVKQADRLIERTQAILERSAEAKRRTEVLLKASRERRAQERLEELASYTGEKLCNSNDVNANNTHRTGVSLDTNGNHENNGHDETNSNVIPAHR